jgi:hypothetical protein
MLGSPVKIDVFLWGNVEDRNNEFERVMWLVIGQHRQDSSLYTPHPSAHKCYSFSGGVKSVTLTQRCRKICNAYPASPDIRVTAQAGRQFRPALLLTLLTAR